MSAIEALFEELVNRGGSDLHLAVSQPPIARVRGELIQLRDAVIPAKELEEMLLELVSPAQRTRLAADLELDLALAYRDVARFRVNLYVKHPGIAATFRLVPGRVPSLAELGCPEVLWQLADRRRGLVLLAGPASSGKTTTLAAMVDHINKTRACHVVTIESPVEFVHEPLRAQITQREVGTHVPSVSAALRSAPRENADVLVISELATPDDIEVALRLANDGRLVLTTVASSSANATLERWLGMFDSARQGRVRGLLADALAGVVVQHLVRATDSKTRLAVHEVLLATSAVTGVIREARLERIGEILKSPDSTGMQSLDAALERLLGANRIAPEVALERAVDKENIARVIARLTPDTGAKVPSRP